MIVNTSTGKLTINKTELANLQKATKILLGLAKHGDGTVAENAEDGAQNLENVLTALAVEETAVEV